MEDLTIIEDYFYAKLNDENRIVFVIAWDGYTEYDNRWFKITNIPKDFKEEFYKYMIVDGIIVKDENYKLPEIDKVKTEQDIINENFQKENEELKKRQQVTQEALDYILMSVEGGV